MMKTPPKSLKAAKTLKEIPEGKSYCLALIPNCVMFFYDAVEDRRWAVALGEDGFYYKVRG